MIRYLAPLVFALLFIQTTHGQIPVQRPVDLHTVERLLFNAQDTVYRARGPEQAAMQCLGGGACGEAAERQELPQQALCKNEGGDDTGSIIWKCEFPEVKARYDIPTYSIGCEGWAYAGDPLVRSGSCVLRYELGRLSEPPPAVVWVPAPVLPPPPPPAAEQRRVVYSGPSESDRWFGFFMFWGLVAAVLVILVVVCTVLDCDNRGGGYRYIPSPPTTIGPSIVQPVFVPSAPPPPPIVQPVFVPTPLPIPAVVTRRHVVVTPPPTVVFTPAPPTPTLVEPLVVGRPESVPAYRGTPTDPGSGGDRKRTVTRYGKSGASE